MLDALVNPTGLAHFVLAAVIISLGIVGLFWRNIPLLILLFLPWLLTICASALHKYPFTDRLLLFLVPTVVILLSYGINILSSFGGEHYSSSDLW
jgi:uncharacterized protein YqgC (DUF456 family)